MRVIGVGLVVWCGVGVIGVGFVVWCGVGGCYWCWVCSVVWGRCFLVLGL